MGGILRAGNNVDLATQEELDEQAAINADQDSRINNAVSLSENNTFTGQLEATSQSLNSDNSLLTQALASELYQRLSKFKPNPDGYFYLCVFGQSNGVGLGRGDSFLDFTSTQFGEVWNHSNQAWEVYDINTKNEQVPPPLGGGAAPVNGEMDMWMPLAYYMFQNYRVRTRFIFELEGGQQIIRFNTPTSRAYLRMIEQLQQSGAPRIDGFALTQGEAQAAQNLQTYTAELDKLINNVKTLNGWSEESKFVAYEIPETINGNTRISNDVNIAFRLLNSDSDPQTSSIPVGSLSTLSDEVHYDTSTLIEMGRVYATALTGQVTPYNFTAQKQGLYQDDFSITDSTGITRSIKDSITPLTIPDPLFLFDAKRGVESTGDGTNVTSMQGNIKGGDAISAILSTSPIDKTDRVVIGESGTGNNIEFKVPIGRNNQRHSFTNVWEFSNPTLGTDSLIRSLIQIRFTDSDGNDFNDVRLAMLGSSGRLSTDNISDNTDTGNRVIGQLEGVEGTGDWVYMVRFNADNNRLEQTIFNMTSGERREVVTDFDGTTTNDFLSLFLRNDFGRTVELKRLSVWDIYLNDKLKENLIDTIKNTLV